MISPLMQVVSLADINDLMIGTDSNALMTLDLSDDDYSTSLMSSVGTVNNTVKDAKVQIYYTNGTRRASYTLTPQLVDGRWEFNFTIPEYFTGYWINMVQFYLCLDGINYDSLPKPSGTYYFSMDYASDFSVSKSGFNLYLWSTYIPENAATLTLKSDLSYEFASGDFYIPETPLNIRTGYNAVCVWTNYSQSDNLQNFGGSYAINFTSTNVDGIDLVGSSVAPDNGYQSDVSSSLSDISSSVESVEEEISLVTQAIQTLQGAMEPHYDNVLTQLHHITEQLHAFYDQVYNNIHLPELAKMDEIIDAISNIDIEFQIDFDELKTSINNMSTAVQNKLQATTDQITGGYDNSGMSQDQQLLDDTLTQYEEIENEVISDAKENISGFEFEDGLSEFAGPLEDISYFLGAIFTGLGAMNVIISFSLTLTIAMCMIGWYRFKGGK